MDDALSMRHRGLALIIVAGVLGLLAALAMAFTTLAQLERRASRQRLNATKARLLARSGVEDAMARLGAGQDPDASNTRYLGEDWNADGILNGPEPAEEVYRPAVLDREGCPARQALRPSFFARDSVSANQPQLLRMDDRRRGYTGKLAGDRVAEGNNYAVKVTPQAGIWVNGGNPALGAAVGYNAVLRRILGNLAEAVDREPVAGVPGADDGSPVDLVDGQNLVNLRPQPGGWTGWEQVRDVALGGSQAKLDAIKPYLALRAWVDTRTLKPDAGSVTQTSNLQTWSQIRLGVDDLGNPTRGLPTLEPRAPVSLSWARSRWPALVALMGGLKGLCLDELYSANIVDLSGTGDSIGRMQAAELVLDWTAASDSCRRVASALAGYAGSLNTWEKWDAYCDTLTSDVLGTGLYPAAPATRSLLKANFNPNSRLNKFNPNRSMWHMVDKQDLLPDGYTTEFVLEPVCGYEVECVGRVLGRNGRLLASRSLRCEVAGPKVARLSTQMEFVCKDLGRLDRAGDETGVRIPGAVADAPFLPPSQGTGVKTWGQDLPGLGGYGVGIQPYPEPYVDKERQGSSTWDLTLAGAVWEWNNDWGYEGWCVWDPANYFWETAPDQTPADCDGSLQLATVETDAGYTYLVNAAPNDMKMLARWTADLDLAVSDADPARSGTTAAAKWRNQPDVSQAHPGNSVLGSALPGEQGLPNTLHPDGCYSERGRAPGYFDKANANGLQGLMSFWVKPNHNNSAGNTIVTTQLVPTSWEVDNNTGDYGWCIWDPVSYFWVTSPAPGPGDVAVTTTTQTKAERQHQFVKWTNFFTGSSGSQNSDQAFMLGEQHTDIHYFPESVSVLLETAHIIPGTGTPPIPGPDESEHQFDVQRGMEAHRWLLLTFAWDLQGSTSDAVGEMVLDAGGVAGECSTDTYPGSAANNAAADEDLTNDDRYGDYEANGKVAGIWPHLISLGRRGFLEGENVETLLGLGADATFDEFAMYDFGPGAAAAGGPAKTLAGWRFKEGRYYKESAYDGLAGSPDTAARWYSPPIDLGGARLRALSWTQVVPEGLRAPQDSGEDGRIEMEITELLGTSYAPDASGNAINTTFRDSVRSPVNRTPSGPFRLHAVFRPNLANMNTPILDPLALDDITLLYDPPGGARIFGWGDVAP